MILLKELSELKSIILPGKSFQASYSFTEEGQTCIGIAALLKQLETLLVALSVQSGIVNAVSAKLVCYKLKTTNS